MQSFFDRSSSARWPKVGRLHIYALPPDDHVAAMATAYQDLLHIRGVSNLSRQPAQWLHMTVERIDYYRDELDADRLAALRTALHEHVATVPAFELQIGPALVSLHSITLDAVPDQPWRDLRQAVRSAAIESLGPDADATMTGHGRPHVTTGFATGPVDIEPHLGALNHVRAGRAAFLVSTAHLVAVHQHVDTGTYTWEPVDTFPLATASSATPWQQM